MTQNNSAKIFFKNSVKAFANMERVSALTEIKLQEFANENNVWRSEHMCLEEMGVADLMDR